VTYIVHTVWGGLVPLWVESPNSGREIGLLAVRGLGGDVDTVIDTASQLGPSYSADTHASTDSIMVYISASCHPPSQLAHLVQPQPKDLNFRVLLSHSGPLGNDLLSEMPTYQLSSNDYC
jgi:hypothetical protein